MLLQVIALLDKQQRDMLREVGVTAQRLTDWKHGRGLPTEVQTALLAEIAGVDRHALQDEITLARATPEQKSVLEGAMKKARGVAVTLAYGATVVAAFAASTGSVLRHATMYRPRTIAKM